MHSLYVTPSVASLYTLRILTNTSNFHLFFILLASKLLHENYITRSTAVIPLLLLQALQQGSVSCRLWIKNVHMHFFTPYAVPLSYDCTHATYVTC